VARRLACGRAVLACARHPGAWNQPWFFSGWGRPLRAERGRILVVVGGVQSGSAEKAGGRLAKSGSARKPALGPGGRDEKTGGGGPGRPLLLFRVEEATRKWERARAGLDSLNKNLQTKKKPGASAFDGASDRRAHGQGQADWYGEKPRGLFYVFGPRAKFSTVSGKGVRTCPQLTPRPAEASGLSRGPRSVSFRGS